MGEYSLTNRADEDLLSIFVFGLENFGLKNAKAYQLDLEKCLILSAYWSQIATLGRKYPSPRT
jgi:plasmid stabilization system protein ParE